MENIKELSPKLKQLIEEQIDLIDDGEWTALLFKAWGKSFNDHEWEELFSILREDLKISLENIDNARWTNFEYTFRSTLESEKEEARLDPLESKINSWSRLDYIMEEVTYQGFTPGEILKWLQKNEKRLKLKLSPLEAEYGWWGSPDWNLGWFNKEMFKKTYGEN